MENLVLGLFTGLLLLCVFLKQPVLTALLAGLALFSVYSLRKGFHVREVLTMWWNGIRTTRNILVTFSIIGFLTALWRADGTIPAIVCYASGLIHPSVILLLTFLLCSMLSFLMGTSFGTAATMGLICMTIADSMGVNPLMTSGAVLSGAMFGDRWSPVSTSALLTCELTKTDLYRNLKNMAKTALLPFFLSGALYFLLGFFVNASGEAVDTASLFSEHFDISWPMLLPAAAIPVLAAFRTPVKRTLLTSLALSAACCLLFQKETPAAILRYMIFGFHAEDADLARVIDGGGFVSMIYVLMIVMIGSCYSGIFEKTGLLRGLQENFRKLSEKKSPFLATFAAALISSVISCNQTLAIMLTWEICEPFADDPDRMALDIEDTAVLIPALIPWSIANNAQITFIGGPSAAGAVPFAFYLYLLPLFRLAADRAARRGKSGSGFDIPSEKR